ncbi:hypothetical protein [Candidatus Poriferisodalis sp.]|uniref:hypothetical protein n=1 Tax=Candidatus Poriferisodalis sp. TaxID=3101277 RepID=UPI003C6FA7D9
MSSQPQMTRRRFLVIVGGAAGMAAVGRHAYAAAGEDDNVPNSDKDGAPDRDGAPDEPEPQRIVVGEGLIDATVWGGSLVTLRNGDTGFFVRDEQREVDYSIGAPDNVQIFCIAASGRLLIAGGHLIREFEPVTFKSGQPYTDLLANAGGEAERLKNQPGAPPQPVGFTFRPTSHRPVLLVSPDGDEWKQVEFSLDPLPGGTVGAILEAESAVAVLRYVDSSITDSGIAVDLVSLDEALQGNTVEHATSLPVSHGGIWGTYQGPSGSVVLTTGHSGVQGRLPAGDTAFALPDEEHLLGVNYTEGGYQVAVQLPTGERVLKTFKTPYTATAQKLTAEDLVLHGVSPEVIIGSSAGFAKAEPYKPTRSLRLQ